MSLNAVAITPCPTCNSPIGQRCRNTVADERGSHRFVATHQRRASAAIEIVATEAAARRWNARGNHPELDYIAAIERDIDKLRKENQ